MKNVPQTTPQAVPPRSQPNINPVQNQIPVDPLSSPNIAHQSQPALPQQPVAQLANQPTSQLSPNDDDKNPANNKMFLYISIAIVVLALLVVGVFAYVRYQGIGMRVQPEKIDETPIIPQELTSLQETSIPNPTPVMAQEEDVPVAEAECAELPNMLESCTAYKCTSTHPLTNEMIEKEIVGMINEKCIYTEQMPNNGQMDCQYTKELRLAVAQGYRDAEVAKSVETNLSIKLGQDASWSATYKIDGVEVVNPLDTALTNGQCIISGY